MEKICKWVRVRERRGKYTKILIKQILWLGFFFQFVLFPFAAKLGQEFFLRFGRLQDGKIENVNEADDDFHRRTLLDLKPLCFYM